MCNLSEGIWEQGMQQGIQQGETTAYRNMAQSMLRKGKYDLTEIAELTSVPLREVQAMARQTAM